MTGDAFLGVGDGITHPKNSSHFQEWGDATHPFLKIVAIFDNR